MLFRLFGGAIDVSPKEEMAKIKTRLLSAEAASKRVCFSDNIKSTRFSWAELEALITAEMISGHELYQGEGRRENVFTWLLTLNGASLSTDMAQRVIEIRLKDPEYCGDWEGEVKAYIDGNRQAILGDLIAFLRQPAKPMKRHSRWATWEAAVLSRTSDPNACLNTILERRGQVDVEAEEGAIIEDFFASKLRWLGYDTEREDVFIPNQIAASWYNRATNENAKVTGVTRALRQLHSEGRLHRICQAREGDSGDRGFRFVGQYADANAIIRQDLGYRLSEKTRTSQADTL
jgi:hypothetical protein